MEDFLLGGQQLLAPRLVLRLYAARYRDLNNMEVEKCFVEYAPVTQQNNKNVLGTFAPAPEEVLKNIGRTLYQSDTSLPALTYHCRESVLGWAPIGNRAKFAFLAPACKRFTQFSIKGLKDMDMLWPRTLFAYDGQTLYAWALPEGELAMNTKLYPAPYPNVSLHGSVCLGSLIVPKLSAYKRVSDYATAWFDAFFLSKGSSDHYNGIKLFTDAKLSLVDMLTQLQRKKKPTAFPMDKLRLSGEINSNVSFKTLGDVLKHFNF